MSTWRAIRFGDGIRFRLILVALIAAVPFVWYRIADIRTAEEQTVATARDDATGVAGRGAAQQDEVFAEIKTLLSVIAKVPAVTPSAPAKACTAFLGSVKDNRPWTKNLLVTDRGGRVVCSSDPKGVGIDLSDREYLRNAVATGQFSVSDVLISRLDGQPVIAAAYPSRTVDGTIAGVLIATMKPLVINQSIADVGRLHGARVLMVDNAGRTLAGYPDPSASPRDDAGSAIAAAMLSGDSGWLERRDDDGVLRLYGIASLRATHARLAVGLSLDAALAASALQMRSAYVNAGLVAATIILLAWLAGELFVLSPLRGLLSATRQLADGNLNARAPLRAPSREFRELAASFNDMADRLAALATSDSLTGVANRRRFEQYLEDEWRRGLRAQYPIALALVDVDGFKLFNDRYGHQLGDECLRMVASELARYARRSEDLVGRYGGEEFVIGLPGLGEVEAYRHCERVRAAIEALDYGDLGLAAGTITISIGVAVLLPIPGASPDRLITMADAALYEAKRGGRNRVALYRPGPSLAAIRVA